MRIPVVDHWMTEEPKNDILPCRWILLKSPGRRRNSQTMEYRALRTTFLPILPINPIPPRRPLTSYGQRTTAQLVRPKSAVHLTSGMSRNHVNIARFYDWSEDLGTCVSVTKLYRDLASMSRVTAEVRRPVGIQWCANGVRLTPGRMFSRDKNALTKGEREIINGICRNRGNSKECYDPPNIKSHQDAWLAGKQLRRVNMAHDGGGGCSGGGDCDGVDSTSRRSLDCTSTDLLNRVIKSASNRTKVQGYYCIKGRPVTRSSDDTRYHGNADIRHHGNPDIPSAPPSTPERLLNSRPRVPPINNGQGAILIEDVKEARQTPRKVRMDVFLPRIPSDHMEDDSEKTSQMMETRHAREQLISEQEHDPDSTSVSQFKSANYSHTTHYSHSDSTNVWDNVRLSNSVCLHHRGKAESLHLDGGE